MLLGIATPDNEFNFYSALWDIRGPDKEPIFNTIDIDLSCNACRRAGKTADCEHRVGLLPQWKSVDRFRIVSAIYDGHDKDTNARENLGAATAAHRAFDPKDVAEFIYRPRVEITEDVREVWVGIDPGAGGKASDYSIAAVVRFKGLQVVCVVT